MRFLPASVAIYRYRGLIFPLEQIIGDGLERRGIATERLQRGAGAGGQAIRFLFRLFQAEQGRVGRLLRGDVLARTLAQLLRRLRHVEDVVDDLESETEALAEIGQALELLRRGIGRHRAQPDRRGNQRCGLVAVNVLQFLDADLLALALEVRDLPGDERLAARGGSEFVDDI